MQSLSPSGIEFLQRALQGLRPLALAGVLAATVPAFAQQGAPPATGAVRLPMLPTQDIKDGLVLPPNTDARNFEGTWALDRGSNRRTVPFDSTLPMTPETRAQVERHRVASATKTQVATPHLTCRAIGIASMTTVKFPIVIVQTPEKLVFLFEEDRNVYQIFLNRGHPAKPKPSYNGDSVAHWEGNTLVVDTNGFNGWGLIDEPNHPNSDQMHMVQRFTKSSDGRYLEVVTTLNDPKHYTQPVTLRQQWVWSSGVRQVENDCSENSVDPQVQYTYENEMFRPVCTLESWDENGMPKVACKKPKR